ncbi:MAG: SDR family oxidoreductase [Candidatus Caldarchaeum sp.]
MRVLVTGGAGYIGSMLVRLLLERGYDVLVLDRLFFGEKPLSDVKDKIRIVRDDIRWFDPKILEGVDAVIDLAALSNDPSGELHPSKTLEINYEGRKRVASLAKKYGVFRYILASSCSVYGFQEGVLSETSQVNPLTMYAKANLLAEEATLALAERNYITTVLRQATVYGFSYRMRFDLAINGMVKGLFLNSKIPIQRDGRQWRPFIHVKDTCRAFVMVLESEPELVNKEIFNVGSDEQNMMLFKLAQLVSEACYKPFNYEWYGSPDNRSYKVSFQKIKKILGFNPTHSIKDGAKEVYEALESGLIDPNDPKTITVQWYKMLISNHELAKDLELHGCIL